MGGFCIPASLALRNALEESGYDDSRVVRGRFQNKGHAWVETQGKIIDIILDQFGGFPSICISDVGDMRYSAVTDDDELKNMGLARIGKTKVFLQRATGSVLPWAARCVTQGAGCGYRRNVSDMVYRGKLPNPGGDIRSDSPYPRGLAPCRLLRDLAHTSQWSLRVDAHR